MTDAGPPRIPPLPPDDRDDKQQQLLGEVGAVGSDLNIFATLVRHPRLFRRWSQFGGVLLTGLVPARERELLILRTGHLCDAAYEWHQHVRIGREAGLTDEEIERIRSGPDADGWDPFDAALLRAADELHGTSRIGDATWSTLAERYDERQLIEVCMVVGQYHLVAFTLNSLGVQIAGDG
jgi:alkylhydroperoxidase family enzyme